MGLCNIDFIKACEREPAYFAGIRYIYRQRGLSAPITGNSDMMHEDIAIDTTPICGAIDALSAISLQIAGQTNLENMWGQLVREHHYLGYQRLLGHHLKYLALMGSGLRRPCPLALRH